MPSPVVTLGLVVLGYTCPAPPVASIVTGATKLQRRRGGGGAVNGVWRPQGCKSQLLVEASPHQAPHDQALPAPQQRALRQHSAGSTARSPRHAHLLLVQHVGSQAVANAAHILGCGAVRMGGEQCSGEAEVGAPAGLKRRMRIQQRLESSPKDIAAQGIGSS